MINQHSTWADFIYVIEGGSPVPFHISAAGREIFGDLAWFYDWKHFRNAFSERENSFSERFFNNKKSPAALFGHLK